MAKNKETTKPIAAYNDVGDNSLIAALKNGGVIIWLSCLIMGLGNFFAGQIIKGVLFLAVEAAFIYYMYNSGLYWLWMLPSLGIFIVFRIILDLQRYNVLCKRNVSLI